MRIAMLTLFLTATVAFADVDSGPKVGDPIEKLTVFGVVGLVEDKEADFAAERKDKPTIYVFVQKDKWTRPMANFLKTLDKEVVKANEDAKVVTVFLGDEIKAIRDYLPTAQKSLMFENTSLCVFEGDKAGPKGWGINADAHLTAVIVKKNKVVASMGYQSVNATDVEKLVKSIK